MKNEIIGIKNTILYCALSFIITSMSIFINKESFWWGIIQVTQWDNYNFMVTNFLEGIMAYIKMSLYLGFITSLISSIILLWEFFISATYKKELNKINMWLMIIAITNFIMFPLVCIYLSKFLLLNAYLFIFMGKFSELLDNLINMWWISQLLWVVPLCLSIDTVRAKYIKNRNVSIIILYSIVSIISPPDVIISITLVGMFIIVLETIVLIKIKKW